MQSPNSKVFGIHCPGAQHTDSVQYVKVVPEFVQGVGLDTFLLNMFIRVDKHPGLLAAVRLASTLAAAAAAVVEDLAPALLVADLDEASIDAALEMEFGVPISLSEHQC